MRTSYSPGSYARSASCTITIGAAANPRRRAASLPWLYPCVWTRTRSCAASSFPAISSVWSLEPSSTDDQLPHSGEARTLVRGGLERHFFVERRQHRADAALVHAIVIASARRSTPALECSPPRDLSTGTDLPQQRRTGRGASETGSASRIGPLRLSPFGGLSPRR